MTKVCRKVGKREFGLANFGDTVNRDDSVSDDGRRGGDARRMTLSQWGSLAVQWLVGAWRSHFSQIHSLDHDNCLPCSFLAASCWPLILSLQTRMLSYR